MSNDTVAHVHSPGLLYPKLAEDGTPTRVDLYCRVAGCAHRWVLVQPEAVDVNANHLPQMSALAGAIADERDENRRLKTELANARAEAVDVNAIRRVITALERAAEGDAHAEALAEERHCPACRASLDWEKHRGGCYLAAILADPAIRPYLEDKA